MAMSTFNRKAFTTSQKELDALWSQFTFGTSHQGRETSDRVMASGFRLRDEKREQSDHDSNEVQFQLHQRLQDMGLWLTEFTRKSEEVTGQIDRIQDYVSRIQRAITAVPPILQVDYEIFKIRKARIGIDQIEDEPHKAVQREVTLLLEEEKNLQSLRKDGEECLRLLRKMGYCLGKQLEDRKKAVAIDQAALNLNSHSSQVVGAPEELDYQIKRNKMHGTSSIIAKSETKSRNPFHNLENEQDWETLSGKQCSAAEKLLKDADNFTVVVESMLQSSCERIQSAVCNTNAAFESRLVGLRRVKAQLEEEHHEISINIRNMEDTLDKLKKSVVEKESSISLAESRLQLRGHRPNFELVKDQAQKGLEFELISLHNSVRVLQGQLELTQRGMRSLLSNQLRIEHEINVKLQSIAIDEANVLPLRKTISVQLY